MDLTPQELSAMFSAPSAVKGRRFPCATCKRPEVAQQGEVCAACFSTASARQEAKAPPRPPADPLRSAQAAAWKDYSLKSALAEQRHANDQRLEELRYAEAMAQVPASAEQLNAGHRSKSEGFWIGLAIGAVLGGLLCSLWRPR